MKAHIVGILLAAGAGSRYGMPKVLAHGGRWRNNAITALLRGGCDEVFVVLGAAEVPELLHESNSQRGSERSRVVVVRNTLWSEGMGSSLRAGLAAAAETRADMALIHVVDTPDVGVDVVARVIQAVHGANRSEIENPGRHDDPTLGLRQLLARAFFGSAPGHPVAIGRHHWLALAATATGDEGARSFLRGRNDVVKVQCSDLASGVDHDVS